MSVYGYVGEEIAVTVDSGTTYRPYSYALTNGANKVEARAFVDAAGFTPVLLSNRYEDLSLNFRLDAYSAFDIDDTCTISITLSGASLASGSYKVTDKTANGTADGIADFVVNFRAIA